MKESLQSAAKDIAQELRQETDSGKWVAQDVSTWLRLLAERLDAARQGKAWGGKGSGAR